MKMLRTEIVRGLSLLTAIAMATCAWGQAAKDRTSTDDGEPQHYGYPEDWSSHHLIMPGTTAADAVAAGVREPRHIYNMVMRQRALENGKHPLVKKHPMKIDWAVSMENGFVPQGQYPAKYSFTGTTESCNGDYVLFALDVASGTQANVVGINNLYTSASPKCNGGTPWVAFAYNTITANKGQILNSPTLSADGTKVAFVESSKNASYFHVLVLPNPIPAPPNQVGTVLNPQTPTSCSTPTTASCMTTVQIANSTDTNSSVWVDYPSDTAYVGADNGRLYKITPVFGGGAPAVISDANWPVNVSTTAPVSTLTDPILDTSANRIFIGDGTGYLYAVNLSNPGKAFSARVSVGWTAQYGAGTGIVDPPIVVTDPANPATDQVFAFTGCSSVVTVGGAITQLPANFTSSTIIDKTNTVDMGSATGAGDCTGGNVHEGTFDNQFWVNGTTGGHMIACGFVTGSGRAPLVPSNPKMFMFPFNSTSHVITATGSTSFVVNTSVGDECSPLTEFDDGTTDRLFFGVGDTGDTTGFLESSKITTSLETPACGAAATSTCVKAPAALGGTSGIVVDNMVANGGTNIYFTTLAPGSVNSQNCPASGGATTPYCAVKLTQAGLQ